MGNGHLCVILPRKDIFQHPWSKIIQCTTNINNSRRNLNIYSPVASLGSSDRTCGRNDTMHENEGAYKDAICKCICLYMFAMSRLEHSFGVAVPQLYSIQDTYKREAGLIHSVLKAGVEYIYLSVCNVHNMGTVKSLR